MSEQPVIKTKARTILHVGAGAGKRLAEWQSGGPDKIVLVEAERAAAARLSQKAATAPNVQVVQAALGTEAGDAELSLWNFSRLNSLQEPTPDLHELFPGLILKDRQIVPVITPADLFAMIGDVARPLSVIVETPGNEMVFLTACKADGVLDQIDQLEILAPEDAFYNGAATRAELETWLVHEGFAVTARDNADADWTVLHLAADHNARALSEAKARIDALSKTIVAGEATLSETQSALKAAKERAEMLEAALSEARAATDTKTKALAERDAALKAEKGRSEGLQAVLTEARAATEAKSRTLAERDAALKAAQDRAAGLETVLAEARLATEAKAKTLAERDAALKAAQERAEGLEALLAEARAATEAKTKALAERDAAMKAATDKISDLEAKVADLGKQRHSAEQKRDEAMSTLDFQTRFQAMLQVDLEALRGRLEQSETQRQRQEELLGKLTSKLSLAAEYLRHLPPSAQESLTAASTPELESPRRRSSGKKQKTKAAQGRGA
jgi:FkbM family methyltransferase